MATSKSMVSIRSNMHPESRFDGPMPNIRYSLKGLNFGNGPWVVLVDDKEIGRFATMQGAQNFCWFDAGKAEKQ